MWLNSQRNVVVEQKGMYWAHHWIFADGCRAVEVYL